MSFRILPDTYVYIYTPSISIRKFKLMAKWGWLDLCERFFNELLGGDQTPSFWHAIRAFYDGDGYPVLPLYFRFFDVAVWPTSLFLSPSRIVIIGLAVGLTLFLVCYHLWVVAKLFLSAKSHEKLEQGQIPTRVYTYTPGDDKFTRSTHSLSSCTVFMSGSTPFLHGASLPS